MGNSKIQSENGDPGGHLGGGNDHIDDHKPFNVIDFLSEGQWRFEQNQYHERYASLDLGDLDISRVDELKKFLKNDTGGQGWYADFDRRPDGSGILKIRDMNEQDLGELQDVLSAKRAEMNIKPLVTDGGINRDSLAVVHVTNYPPTLNPDGSASIQSTYQATGGDEARSTVHFTLNHKVEGHMQGRWDDTRYAIIAPFNGVVSSNGVPAVINPADTFWPTNGRDPLKIPDATFVAPSEEPIESLVIFDGSRVTYKTTGFTPQDEELLMKIPRAESSLARAVTLQQREAIFAQLSQEHAVKEALRCREFEVRPASAMGEWGDINHAMVTKLAESMGTRANINHMNTGYHRLSESMNRLLAKIDFLEARAGNGNTLEEENGQIKIITPDSVHRSTVRASYNKAALDQGNLEQVRADIEDHLNKLEEEANDLDAKTREMTGDFREKITARTEGAIGIIADPSLPRLSEQKTTASGSDIPQTNRRLVP